MNYLVRLCIYPQDFITLQFRKANKQKSKGTCRSQTTVPDIMSKVTELWHVDPNLTYLRCSCVSLSELRTLLYLHSALATQNGRELQCKPPSWLLESVTIATLWRPAVFWPAGTYQKIKWRMEWSWFFQKFSLHEWKWESIAMAAINETSVVVPGERIGGLDQFTPGAGTYIRHGFVHSCLVGYKHVQEVSDGEVSVRIWAISWIHLNYTLLRRNEKLSTQSAIWPVGPIQCLYKIWTPSRPASIWMYIPFTYNKCEWELEEILLYVSFLSYQS